MAIISPVGGSVFSGVGVDVPVNQWDCDDTGPKMNVTQTDAGGGTAYRGFVKDPQWSFTLFLDDADFSTVVDFEFGTQIATLFFQYGDNTSGSLIENTMVNSCKINLNAEGTSPVSVSVSGGGGYLTPNTTNG